MPFLLLPDMQKNHSARNQFQTQHSENTMVLKVCSRPRMLLPGACQIS